MGIGDWGLGIWDWGLGPIPNSQCTNSTPHDTISDINFNAMKIINIGKNVKEI